MIHWRGYILWLYAEQIFIKRSKLLCLYLFLCIYPCEIIIWTQYYSRETKAKTLPNDRKDHFNNIITEWEPNGQLTREHKGSDWPLKRLEIQSTCICSIRPTMMNLIPQWHHRCAHEYIHLHWHSLILKRATKKIKTPHKLISKTWQSDVNMDTQVCIMFPRHVFLKFF